MRIFTDSAGRVWEVVAGRESWGAIFAIFVPRGWQGEVRQTLLEGTTQEAGTNELEGLEEDELQALLDRSEPKPLG